MVQKFITWQSTVVAIELGLEYKHQLLLFDKTLYSYWTFSGNIFGKIVFHQGVILSSVVPHVRF